MSPASLTSNSRRTASPISRLSNSRTRWSLSEGISKLLGDFLDGVALDIVAELELTETFDADAAFHAGAHFIDLILKAAQGLGQTFVNDFFATADAHFALDDATSNNHAAGHRNTLGQFENLADLGGA